MHEFSLCESLVETMLRVLKEEEAKRGRPVRLLGATLVVGRLRQVIPENMETAYAVLTRGTAAEGSELKIEQVPVRIDCGKCGWSGEGEPTFMVCPECEDTDVQVVSGKELYLKDMEIAAEDEGDDEV